MTQKGKLLIIGAGPSGLAASMLFSDLGWQDITVVERRTSAKDFEKNKAFTYQIDGRGQKLLKRLGLEKQLGKYGVANDSFHATTVAPDGSSKTISSPIISKDRVTCYWTTRRNLQTMLYEAIQRDYKDNITLLYDHQFTDISVSESGETLAHITDTDGNEQQINPDLLLACDGLASRTRESLKQLPGISSDQFEMKKYPSPSCKLMYKVINLPPTFSIKGDASTVDDHRMAYVFTSRHKDSKRTMALFGFPVANEKHVRSVNIIREADHHLWTIDDAKELLLFLQDSFPQLDINNLISEQEAADFISIKTGQFPAPQYASSLFATVGGENNKTHCLLIGDAAHAFPPDLGLGVNSAFEDLFELELYLQKNDLQLEKACAEYEVHRLKQSQALVKLVQTVFPYQYNQKPWRMKAWVIRFLLQNGLHKLLPFMINKPAFLSVQNHQLEYTEILAQKKNTDLIFNGIFLATTMILGLYILSLIF